MTTTATTTPELEPPRAEPDFEMMDDTAAWAVEHAEALKSPAQE